MTIIKIDPITRISGLLGIEVNIEKNKIQDVKVQGNQFRGFEKMFIGREPFDIIRLAPRICGICSTHHAIASTLSIEDSMKVTPEFNGKVVRDIANAFEFLQNEIRHIYFFVMPDYVKMVEINPFFKTDEPKYQDYRLNKEKTNIINTHYLNAVRLSREAHRAVAILAGKAPHCHGVWIGGTSTNINIQQLEGIKYIISEIKEFILNELIPDVQLIASAYSDYFSIGKGHGNLMTYGIFNDYNANINYSNPKVRVNNIDSNFNVNNITESIKSTWVDNSNNKLIPGETAPSNGNPFKEGAYSWINSPRYSDNPMEVGALARMTLSGIYTRGISVMDRIVAKSLEAKKICEVIEELINLLELKKAVQKQWQVPVKAEGIGLTEAERGSLGHWISIDNKKVSNYTIITPSAWNLSPMDGNGIKGTVEQALIGTEVEDSLTPVIVGRIVRSFDPCSNCAAHIVSDKYKPIIINIRS